MLLTNSQFRDVQRWLRGLQPGRMELNSWEEGFVSSVADGFDRQGRISDRQFETLEKLYNEKGNG